MKTNYQQMLNSFQNHSNMPYSSTEDKNDKTSVPDTQDGKPAIFAEVNDIDFNAPWLHHITPKLCNHSIYTNSQLDKTKQSDSQQSIQLFEQLNLLINQIHQQPLKTGQGKTLTFVHQSVLDDINNNRANAPIAYETHIADTGQIPTRNNLHDLFNAWIWLTFPKTKAMLNRHQAEQIAQDGISGSRGRVRDAITVLDENGAILITSNPELATALKAFDWTNCLVNPRSQWVEVNSSGLSSSEDKTIVQHDKQAQVMICGHALLEQLVEPRKPLCAHTFVLQVEPDFFTLSINEKIKKVDELLVEQVDSWLHQDKVTPRDLSPLPILGVPYFWQDNADPEFYQDSYVFRSGRKRDKNKNKKNKNKINQK